MVRDVIAICVMSHDDTILLNEFKTILFTLFACNSVHRLTFLLYAQPLRVNQIY